jgi:4-amino-4-deoxy-L-arabinose transferase-like glycosyltransferase
MDHVGYPDSNSGARRLSTNVVENIGFALVLALAALLRVWHLNQAGFGTQYYAAGVLSMLESWHNFFFNSFDPAGFVSVDKPPLALWLQVASARILGFSGMSIHLPQVIEGVAAVALLYHLVRRRFGAPSGLLSALFLAVTPISVAIDRSNNTDSALVLGLLAAAWALSLAVESASLGMLLVSMVMLGIAFNVKMLAAIVVVPPFMAAYFFGTPLPMPRKAAQLLLALAVLAIVSLLWCAAYDLTPAQSRPYAGSTKNNSMLELVIGENGVRRFVRLRRFGSGPVGALRGTQGTGPGTGPGPGPAAPGAAAPGGASNAPANPGVVGRAGDRVPVGLLRLANPLLAIQMGWLYPLAAVSVAASLWRKRERLPLDSLDTALLLWAGWTVTYGLVLSYAGGIFHPYYLAAMAPPVCALAGIGVVRLWGWYREGGSRALVLPATVLAVVAWQIYIGHGYVDWQLNNPQRGAPPSGDALRQVQNALIAGSIAAAALGAGGLLFARTSSAPRRRGWPLAALTAGILAVILIPAAWAFGSMQYDGNANSPTALPPISPGDGGGARTRGTTSADPQLVAFLTSHHGEERFLLATLSAQQAAPIIIATGKAVMAMGGFAGTDPILTPENLSQMVQQGQLRFALIGANGAAGVARGTAFAAGRAGFAAGGALAQAPLVEWVQQHGKIVEPALWRAPRAEAPDGVPRVSNRRNPGARGFNSPAASQLFDLRPDAASAAVSPQDSQRDPARDDNGEALVAAGSGH